MGAGLSGGEGGGQGDRLTGGEGWGLCEWMVTD